MKINQEQKISILMQSLDERYKSIHIIRERTQVVSLWILGILLGVSGWLFQADLSFSLCEKFISITLLIIIWITIYKYYFKNLEKGFNGQRQVAAKIEDSLGLFTLGEYIDEDSVYPVGWQESGQKDSEGDFFDGTYKLLAIGFAILIIMLLIS